MRLLSLIILVGIAGSFSSCSPDRYEVFNQNNEKPSITFSQGDKNENDVWVVNERIKVGLKTTTVPLDVTVSGKDGEYDHLMLDAFYEDVVEIRDHQGKTIDFPIEIEEEKEFQISIVSEALGLHTVEFDLSDELGKITRGKVNIDVFVNEPPVAVISDDAKYVGVNSINEYEISAEESYDQDSDYGGRVVQYVWSVNGGDEFITEDDHFNQSLSQGGYEITLRVIDSDGVSSEKVEKLITIQ